MTIVEAQRLWFWPYYDNKEPKWPNELGAPISDRGRWYASQGLNSVQLAKLLEDGHLIESIVSLEYIEKHRLLCISLEPWHGYSSMDESPFRNTFMIPLKPEQISERKRAKEILREKWMALNSNTKPPECLDKEYKLAKEEKMEKTSESNTKVFVIHGRDLKISDDFFGFLRALNMSPIEWSEAVNNVGKPNPYIGEILDYAFKQAQALIVLLSPDDLAMLDPRFHSDNEPPYETVPTGQARPNVLFEAGMAIGRHPDRTIIVEIGQLRPFSDIAGKYTTKFDGSPKSRHNFANSLRKIGCNVNTEGTHWLEVGDFKIIRPPSQEFPNIRKNKVDISSALGEYKELSKASLKILRLAAQYDGELMKVNSKDGIDVIINRKPVSEMNEFEGLSGNRLEAAIEELYRYCLINDISDSLYRVSSDGYTLCDKLNEFGI